jgi:hypothetical protein
MPQSPKADRMRTNLKEIRENLFIHTVSDCHICRTIIQKFIKSLPDTGAVKFAKVVSLCLVDCDVAVELGYVT